jgi:hypothetical protein
MRLARGTSPNDSRETVERVSKTGSFHPSQSSWLGVVTVQPQVGARVVIGTYMSSEFTVTSPVEKIVERQDGMLVQTTSKNRYFIAHSGDAFLVRRFG